ncbi:MAG: decarboxylating 6-phosphogluconate dehydrogenase [Micrococcales bacterium]|nr:decarboxylating 6-phosphogluconate dehydrogenase [Micrococcales bacterium]NBR60972.1 decarboxylating 6-phosphogluconate dehydrogenase [Actinomycetota bacterium]NBR55205.1 decarboxylating 6-phosphogluconate dehydrogenase [Micrococcales bacterium]NBT46776.1 decarboxylating 6-phosphogluconate dehydrogenase [Actinomycetota bacterium]NBY43681.1 decarboxylating 6-phosphogluconate dehydrogenase [Micrococcales bacterium]
MHIGLVGLGKMGGNMRTRLRNKGIEVTGYSRNPDVADVTSIEEMVKTLPSPKTVWIMVPHGKPTDDVIDEVSKYLEPGDLIIEGGNSRFSDDIRHATELATKGIGYLDCGVSGGVWGLQNGYGLMVGGDVALVEKAMPIFDALRPEGERAEGFVHVGDVGAGHYAKMVHNGIEYAMMQAFAEGYELLEKKEIIKDVHGTFAAWQKGTVVRSWLLDLLVKALEEDPGLSQIKGYVEDSGEGRWTVEEAIANSVPMPAITAALFARFTSRQDDSPAMKAVSALRNQFGGHAVKKAD